MRPWPLTICATNVFITSLFRIHPFHVQRLVLRLAVAGDGHHVAQGDGVLARIVVFAQSRRGEEFGHGEWLESDRQQRQGDVAGPGHIAGDGLAQRRGTAHGR